MSYFGRLIRSTCSGDDGTLRAVDGGSPLSGGGLGLMSPSVGIGMTELAPHVSPTKESAGDCGGDAGLSAMASVACVASAQ
jgi:hypothetical protein